MSMEYRKIFNGNLQDISRKEIIAHSIRILRANGQSDEKIKEELQRDFSIQAEVLDEMLKA